jgi:hypothetical protein
MKKMSSKLRRHQFTLATFLGGSLVLGACAAPEAVRACERLDPYLGEMSTVMSGWNDSTDWSVLVERQESASDQLIGNDLPDARTSETANLIEYLVFVDETVLGSAKAGFSADRSIEARKLHLENARDFLENRPDAVVKAKAACRDFAR